ncbi:hypothetical protein BTVI_108964 [Pitangus sulphuratus]|nr:hypothetical protein BTVI_108964 [Pitangus sulphuratus]
MALRATRENKPVKCKYLAGKEIDGNVHAVVIAWLAKVREKFKLQEQTLFMTVAITDHFLLVDSKQYVLAKYLMELCIVDYDMDHLPPPGIAAAVFCLPLKLLNGYELLPSLQHYMFYTESDLLPIMQYMTKNVVLVNKGAATRSLRDEMKQRLTEYSAAIRDGQTTFLDRTVEEKNIQSTTEDLQINKEEAEVSLWNKTLALQRIQLMAALRNKVNQDDEDSCAILETVNHIVLLSQTIMHYQQNIIIGSGVNWAEDPSLKAIVLQLEKNVYLP